jgi:hypothetical protein
MPTTLTLALGTTRSTPSRSPSPALRIGTAIADPELPVHGYYVIRYPFKCTKVLHENKEGDTLWYFPVNTCLLKGHGRG